MKLAVALILAVAPVTALHAQYQRLAGSDKELSEYINEYARCMVLYQKDSSRKLVLSDTPNDQLERRFGDIYSARPLAWVAGCNRLTIRDGAAFRLQPNMFRAALARHLVLADVKSAPASFAGQAALHHQTPELPEGLTAEQAAKPTSKKQAALARQYAMDTAASWLSRYGECVVRSDATGSYHLVTSEPSTPEERGAFTKLNPVFAGCLSAGEELKLGRDVLRGAVAISLYRLSMAQPGSAGVLK